MPLPPRLRALLNQSPELSRAYVVGGCVRDWLLGETPKDIDVEVYGLDMDRLEQVLNRWGRVDRVGKAFGVLKLRLGDEGVFDFSLPRRDSKIAQGHRGFSVEFDPEISIQEACARRDYTINAILYDPRTDALVDLFDGARDLAEKRLRHIGPPFVEDPLRVLRGMQFCARFDLEATPETAALCASIVDSIAELPVERVWEEWWKWATKGRQLGRGIEFLRASGWQSAYPEIDALTETPQDPQWHPEGDVWIHTCHCLNALSSLESWRRLGETERAILSLATLAHDFGKPRTTVTEVRNGIERVVSPGHDRLGADLSQTFLQKIGAPNHVMERVPLLVAEHMSHTQVQSDRAVRRLANRLRPVTIDHLSILMTADSMGRPPLPQTIRESVADLVARAKLLNLKKHAPSPILLGRHLIEFGMQPGKDFGDILSAAFEAQLDGSFADEEGANQWLRRFLDGQA